MTDQRVRLRSSIRASLTGRTVEYLLRVLAASLAAVPASYGLTGLFGLDSATVRFRLVLVLVTGLVVTGIWLAQTAPVDRALVRLSVSATVVAAAAALAVLELLGVRLGGVAGVAGYVAITAALATAATMGREAWSEWRVRRALLVEAALARQYVARPETTQLGAETPDAEALRAARYDAASARAEADLRNHLPLNPRTAKRVLNHLRLALVMAQIRGAFEHERAGLQRSQVAKWVLLTELWPGLRGLLVAEPDAMAALESAGDEHALADVLATRGSAVPASPELLGLLCSGVRLAPVRDLLVRL